MTPCNYTAIYRDMLDDFGQCLVSNTRKAARAITRRYDAYARPFGITSTQFSLMGAIMGAPGRTCTELAEERGFERTTLLRNVDRLERQGFVASRPAEHGNRRYCELTPAGHELIRRMLPGWRKAQADMQAELGAAGFAQAIETLKRLAAT